MRYIKHLKPLLIAALALNMIPAATAVDSLPPISGVELQPLSAHVKRIVQTLEMVGSPLDADRRKALDAALSDADPRQAVRRVQTVLDPLCLAMVNINPESRVKVSRGPAAATLIQQGWRVFLLKVHNEAGVTASLNVTSPNAARLVKPSTGSAAPSQAIKPHDVADRWMDLQTVVDPPLAKELSGLALEYRVVQLFSRDVGKREAKLAFDIGQGTQDLAYRNELNVLFVCEPAVEVTLDVIDHDGRPTTGQFVIRDGQGRVYPLPGRRRLAPDFFFHEQIYRHSGESVWLPAGKYNVVATRGPEYRIEKRQIEVPRTASHKETFRLKRWINMAAHGWYSGDHHIHAAGCAHYESPSEGVQPADMMRHILGEDLNVGCVLSWGPCWYFQKQYFEGRVHKLSQPKHLMRYDIEVSGFPSSHAGHLCLLRLKEDDYPGTKRIEDWPSWDLPVLKWGREQGAIIGFSHSGWGLEVPDKTLPNYAMPKFDGIGANEYIVDVVHGVCDFISAVDTPSIWELNIWYHTLNCGYQTRISGETDFPCIYGQRVGLGRVYVKLDSADPLDYDRWVEGVRDGRSYCCDGLSHLFDLRVGGLAVGERGANGRTSVLAAKAGKSLAVAVRAAALLDEQPQEQIRSTSLSEKPYWHVERARVGQSRKVPVELIVNGQSVERREITADGSVENVEFDYVPQKSCWIAVRIFPSSHTNPVFVEIDGKPVRASRRSAQWCLDAVDVCWKQKSKLIRPAELAAAESAYETARKAYRQVLAEAEDE